MTAREQHGKDRAGKITASIASTIMSGGEGAWDTLLRNLWADDGSDFAVACSGARAHGLLHEDVGLGLFWERHPGWAIESAGFQPFARRGYSIAHPYRRLLGFSPDAFCLEAATGRRLAGIEVKSPVDPSVYTTYAAFCARRWVPPEHVDQVRFSLWASGLPAWHFVAHHDGQYAETSICRSDSAHRDWIKRFTPRLDAFLDLYLTGARPARDKLNSGGLAALIRRTTP